MVVRPNRYEAGRANIAVYNWSRSASDFLLIHAFWCFLSLGILVWKQCCASQVARREEISTSKMSDLSNRIDQIEKGFENRQLTKSMLEDSLRYDPDAYLDQLTKSMQRTRSLQRQEETKAKIDDLEYS